MSKPTMIANDNKPRQHKNDPLSAALEWDWGTAYELLLSLDTLVCPKHHGVPAPWAAGVRKRLSPRSQADFKSFFGPAYGISSYTPIHLVLEMEPPKTAQRFLEYVDAIPDDAFSRRMHLPLLGDDKVIEIVRKGLAGKRPTPSEMEEY